MFLDDSSDDEDIDEDAEPLKMILVVRTVSPTLHKMNAYYHPGFHVLVSTHCEYCCVQ